MNGDQINLLIISDLHAHSLDPRASTSPSYYSTNTLYSASGFNPLAEIPALIKAAGLSVDLVLMPGDIGDRADPAAQKAGWTDLDRIREEVGALELIGATGNHDLDSRRVYPDFDPKGALQALIPCFPLAKGAYEQGDRVLSDQFWSRNFVLVPYDEADLSLLIINSCAFHGFASEAGGNANEHLRGKISPITLEAIRSAVSTRTTKTNVALFHHHIARNPWIEDGNSEMVGGDKLVEVLKDTQKQWLVIHGHRHVPSLTYADSTPLAPVILSSGSVAARTYEVRGRHARNQIHHVSIKASAMDPSGAEMLGEVKSWTWIAGLGWEAARRDGGLPSVAGFGYRPHALEMRNQLVEMARAAPNGILTWKDAASRIPKLAFMSPDDLEQLAGMVEASRTAVEWGKYGVPTMLECKA